MIRNYVRNVVDAGLSPAFPTKKGRFDSGSLIEGWCEEMRFDSVMGHWKPNDQDGSAGSTLAEETLSDSDASSPQSLAWKETGDGAAPI